jgi:hypothetical protein
LEEEANAHEVSWTENGTGPVLEGWAVSFVIYLANTGPVPLARPQGAQQELLDFLTQNGIQFVVH